MPATEMQFYPLTGEVRLSGNLYRFRPKTFELLHVLASTPFQVWSKTDLMQQLWADAVVEEQAIFQSINEIRKAFAPIEVIKTYPKKGYAWVLPLTTNGLAQQDHHSDATAKTTAAKNACTKDAWIKDASQTSTATAPASTPLAATPAVTQAFFRQAKKFRVVMLTTLLVATLVLFVSPWLNPLLNPWLSTLTSARSGWPLSNPRAQTGQAVVSHQSVLVLPFDVSKLDSSQHWLKFAGMDALIQQLAATDTTTIFQLPDVLDILKRLPPETTTTSLSESQIGLLFQLAGVSQLVQVTISGVPGDYQLITTVHQQGSTQKNVLHSTTLEQNLPQLAGQIATTLSLTSFSKKLPLHIDFQNQLLANAIELVAQQQFQQALPLALSAISLDHHHVLAYYVLSDIQLRLGMQSEALSTTEHALLLPQSSNSPYFARLWYNKGVLLAQQGNHNAAEQNLLQAATAATEHKDWLYLAYSQSMLGQINLAQRQYAKALELLNAALQYQQILHCPQGIAQAELDLASYFMLTQQPDIARQHYANSKKLVTGKGLRQLQALLLEFEHRWLNLTSEQLTTAQNTQ